MFLQSLVHVPEVLTGGIGVFLIGLAFYKSIQHNKSGAAHEDAAIGAE
jgi:hypothetical protein